MSYAGRRTVALALALPLIASILTGPLGNRSAEATELTPPAFGAQFHATWGSYTDAQRTEVLDKLAAAGVKWVRIDIGWASVQEVGPGQWSDWYINRLDRVVNQARERGIQVLGTLWLTPSWANGGIGTRKPPTDPADYAVAARHLAEHFKGRISAWEVWNEPNLINFYDGSLTSYVSLLKVAYPAFKLGDPSAAVVLGGPSTNDSTWLRSLYEAGAQGSFDVMATHPYQGFADAPPETPDNGTRYTMAHVSQVYELMREFGDGDKKIWFTEFGWSSHDNWEGVPNWQRGVTEAQQADYAVRTIEYLKANHPYVTNIFWYNERNRTTGNPQLDNYGLLYQDLSPKPVYSALKQYLTAVVATPTVVESPTPVSSPTVLGTPLPVTAPTAEESPTPLTSPSVSEALAPVTAPTAEESPTPVTNPTVSQTPTPVTTPTAEESPTPVPSPTATETPAPVTTPTTVVPPLVAVPEMVTPIEMLTNGGFEKGVSPWTGSKATLTRVSDAFSGSYALKLGGGKALKVLSSEKVPSPSGLVWATGQLKSPAGQTVKLFVVEIVNGAEVVRGAVSVNTTGAWQALPVVTYQPTSTSSSLLLRVKQTVGRADILVDGLSMVRN